VRHFSRFLFGIASLLSLFLCLTTVALWVRSYHTAHIFEREEFRPSELDADFQQVVT
jgi:hypothetical protein